MYRDIFILQNNIPDGACKTECCRCYVIDLYTMGKKRPGYLDEYCREKLQRRKCSRCILLSKPQFAFQNTIFILAISYYSIAVRRHPVQSNFYKNKHFIVAFLQLQMVSPLSPWWRAWGHTGRHECYISKHRRKQKNSGSGEGFLKSKCHWNLKATTTPRPPDPSETVHSVMNIWIYNHVGTILTTTASSLGAGTKDIHHKSWL